MPSPYLAPEFWPEDMARGGDIVTRKGMDAAWRDFVDRSANRPMSATTLQGSLGRKAGAVSMSSWPFPRIAEAMLQRARKAGVIRHKGGGVWEFTPEYAADTPDAYEQGYDAYERGRPETACPYPAGSGERELWLDGWNAANQEAGE